MIAHAFATGLGGLAGLACAIWLYLILGNGRYWTAGERDTRGLSAEPLAWPRVVAVVPARDEADVIARSIASLAAQDYPGPFHVILVDDGSRDGTARIAQPAGGERLTIMRGADLPAGWTGKLWAVSQGIAASGETDYLWLTDADIEHAPDTLRMLVTRAHGQGHVQGHVQGRVLVSLMAKLRCRSLAESAFVPAFIYFFQMLYPFARANAERGQAAAAGGCMLVRREALERAGGIGMIRGALIDDCAFGALMKTQGRIWIGLTDRSRSIRPYEGTGAIAAMISRSAYAQLDYSPLRLLGTIVGLMLVFGVPPGLALFGNGLPRVMAAIAWGLMILSFQPMLRFYRRSPLWGVVLPLIAAFYAGCTLLSGWQHWRGRGGMWKGRAQAMARS